MKATIVSIGDEILIGQTINTNAGYISKALDKIGIPTKRIITIGDNKEDIFKSLERLISETEIIIVTGGLGPTNDDITKNVLCEIFNTDLVLDNAVLENIERLLNNRGFPLNDNNKNQAFVPQNATVLNNNVGTAPGLSFKTNIGFLFALPGVPFEMKFIMDEHVIKFLQKNVKTPQIYHKNIFTAGLPEAVLAEKLSDWESKLPKFIKLAYLPSPGYIVLRLSIFNYNSQYQATIDNSILELKNIIPKNILSETATKPEQLISELLLKHKKTVSTAESCTGGKIASLITSIPGCSEYYKGSIVSYDNSVKERLLKVNPELLESKGAVSKEVVEKMATSCLNLLDTDYAISVSGIAGPGGGSEDKPVGTVWIAIASKTNVISKNFQFNNDRPINILRSANMALIMLAETIIEESQI